MHGEHYEIPSAQRLQVQHLELEYPHFNLPLRFGAGNAVELADVEQLTELRLLHNIFALPLAFGDEELLIIFVEHWEGEEPQPQHEEIEEEVGDEQDVQDHQFLALLEHQALDLAGLVALPLNAAVTLQVAILVLGDQLFQEAGVLVCVGAAGLHHEIVAANFVALAFVALL